MEDLGWFDPDAESVLVSGPALARDGVEVTAGARASFATTDWFADVGEEWICPLGWFWE